MDVVENVIVERFGHRGGKSSTLVLPTSMALLKFPKMLKSQIRTQLTKGRTDTCFQPSSSIKKKSGRTSEVMTKRTTYKMDLVSPDHSEQGIPSEEKVAKLRGRQDYTLERA